MMLVSADELRSIIVRTTPEGFVLVPVDRRQNGAAGFCVSEADRGPSWRLSRHARRITGSWT